MYTLTVDRMRPPATPPPPPFARPYAITWAAVMGGQEPAESLPSAVRAALFRALLAWGWTVPRIAAWTRTTEYTVTRALAPRDRV